MHVGRHIMQSVFRAKSHSTKRRKAANETHILVASTCEHEERAFRNEDPEFLPPHPGDSGGVSMYIVVGVDDALTICAYRVQEPPKQSASYLCSLREV